MSNDIGKANVSVIPYLFHGVLYIACGLAIHNARCTITCIIVDDVQDNMTIYMQQIHGYGAVENALMVRYLYTKPPCLVVF